MKTLLGSLLVLALSFQASAAPKHLLVVTTTKGFRHSSIPVAERILGEIAERSGDFTVEYASVEPTDPQFTAADGKPDKEKVDAAAGTERPVVIAADKNVRYEIVMQTTDALRIAEIPRVGLQVYQK